MDPYDQLAAFLIGAAGAGVRMVQATVTGVAPLTVEGSDGPVDLRALGWYDPAVGDQVMVLRDGTTGIVLGATTGNQRPPGIGTVTAYTAGASVVTVKAGTGSYVLPRAKSYTPTVADTCLIQWNATPTSSGLTWTGVAVDAVASTPTPVTVPKTSSNQPPDATSQITPTAPTTGTATVQAVQTATWRGEWNDDTGMLLAGGDERGLTNTGLWLYGDAFLPWQGRTVTDAAIWLPAATQVTGVLQLHDQPVRADLAPTLLTGLPSVPVTLDAGSSSWVPLPTAMVQALLDGTAAGIAVTGTQHPPGTLYGLTQAPTDPGADTMSGALRLNWSS